MIKKIQIEGTSPLQIYTSKGRSEYINSEQNKVTTETTFERFGKKSIINTAIKTSKAANGPVR